ncbi:MAG: hypothetical protein PHD82_17685, partial [Candidatus Riflebacteria bacterium]|nr:hypothetical protein [Candidatus Riflebacteria bacterium]
MRRLPQQLLLAVLLISVLFGPCRLQADNSGRDFYRDLGEFAAFIGALHGARDAFADANSELEQLYLKKAEKILDRIKKSPSTALVHHDFKSILLQQTFSRLHGSSNSRLHQLYAGLSRYARGGLYEHLVDAIRSHEHRMPYYAGKTQGRSDAIFKKIATLQRLNLPVAWYIDLQAGRFQKDGIPIITADLVDMKTIYPAAQPPAFKGKMTAQTLSGLRQQVKAFQKKAMHSLKKAAFQDVAAATHDLVTLVRKLEQEHAAHLAMTVHMLDSIGYSALHAARYQQLSAGETDGLARQYLAIQIFPLQECLPTDHKAQDLHAMGAGVIVNDVPEIP